MGQPAESWEQLELERLTLTEHPVDASPSLEVESSQVADAVTKPPTPPPAEVLAVQTQASGQSHAHAGQSPDSSGDGQPTGSVDVSDPPQPHPQMLGVDAAILQALSDPTQRATVLKCEELVEKFLAEPGQEVLQFPASFSSYQRMLAHRVGQYYGLQTSTVDYEESQGRVVGLRTAHCQVPKTPLGTLEVRADPNAQVQRPSGNGLPASGSDKPRLLRRQDDDRAQQGGPGLSTHQSPARSMKERHENYMKAREELGLGSAGGGAGGPHEGTGRGRGGPGRFGGPGRMDGGRGRKAVFRDKDKDLSDPDYRRGMNRFNGAARFDPAYGAMVPGAGGIYQVPTYQSEFPTLNRLPSNTSSGRQASAQQQPQGGSGSHGAHGQQGGVWGQQQGQGSRQPPPPPPPHHGGGANNVHGGKGGRQQQQQQQQGYGAQMGAPYPGAQYQVPVMGGGYMPGQAALYGVAPGQAMPAGAVYAQAPGAGPAAGGAFYPGMGMGMGMVAGPGGYGYIATGPAPGSSEGLTMASPMAGAYPVFATYPHGTAVYHPAPSAMYPGAAGAPMHMRPMVPYYTQHDAAQYGSQQTGGDGRQFGAFGHGSGQHQSYGQHHNQHHQHAGNGGFHGSGSRGQRNTDADNSAATTGGPSSAVDK